MTLINPAAIGLKGPRFVLVSVALMVLALFPAGILAQESSDPSDSGEPAESGTPIAGSIELLSSGAVSEFPLGMRFSATAKSDVPIVSMAVRFRIGLRTRGVFEYLEFESAEVARGELFWRTAIGGGYIPPETIITYVFEIEDERGSVLVTEPHELIFEDVRFTWERVSSGPISVAYHGPVRTRAESILVAITDTLEAMGPVLGADIDDPIRVIVYNNQKEMLEALPPRSAAVGRELVTEGQAYNEIGTLMVLGGGRLALGTASHEVTHILNYRAGQGVARRLPSWLHEGLAEYGNVDPGYSYDVALEFAIATDRLLPHLFMQTLPGKPEDVIIFYGQSKSVVNFMISLAGEKGMRTLLSMLKDGEDMDSALLEVYGLDRLGLTNAWRASIGAEPYVPPRVAESRPTPVPYPTVRSYTLTPQAGGQTVGDASAQEPTEGTAADPADTTPTPTAQATTPPPAPGESEEMENSQGPTGGSCGAGVGGDTGVLTSALLLFSAAGAGWRLRRRR